MALTKQTVLRQMLLLTLPSMDHADATKARVLAELDRQYGHLWSEEDREFMPSNGEMKWRNRAAQERRRMVDQGLIDNGLYDRWILTPRGQQVAQATNPTIGELPSHVGKSAGSNERAVEIARRESMWETLKSMGGPAEVTPDELGRLRIFRGGRGVYVDLEHTRTSVSPFGAAVSFLHTGRTYDDELSSDGVRYHFPRTSVGSRDQMEVNASRAACILGLPVFVVTSGGSYATRSVHRGYVEEMDLPGESMLITFTDADLPPPLPDGNGDAPFELDGGDSPIALQARRARPNQQRFAFQVLKRYGTKCAVCEIGVKGVVQAAHLKPKKLSGSDDPRNGLPLCANHHFAFDGRLWGIEPHTTEIAFKADGPTRAELGITKSSLRHLPAKPHTSALEHCWSAWKA